MRTVEPASAEPLTSGLLSLAGESGSVSVRLGAAGGEGILGVGQRRRATRGVRGAVGGRGAEVRGLIAGDRGRDPGAAEGGGGAGSERSSRAVGTRVDPDCGARFGRALDLWVVVVGRRVGVCVGEARRCGGRRVALDAHHVRHRGDAIRADHEQHVVPRRGDFAFSGAVAVRFPLPAVNDSGT